MIDRENPRVCMCRSFHPQVRNKISRAESGNNVFRTFPTGYTTLETIQAYGGLLDYMGTTYLKVNWLRAVMARFQVVTRRETLDRRVSGHSRLVTQLWKPL